MPTDTTSSSSPATLGNPIRSGEGFAFFMAAALVALWAISAATWGLAGLFLPAVAATPMILLVLIVISRG